MHDNTRAAINEGRRRWVERMREAKARGEIERFPGGRRARGLPRLSRDPTIRKAQRILEARVSKAVVPTASNATKADKLSDATDKSLDLVLGFLNRDVDPEKDPKLFAQQLNSAHLTINTQVRVDNAKLTAEALGPAGLNEQELRERARRLIREAFAERPPRDNGIVIEHDPDDSGS
jgi:hypothetical protein